MEAAEHPYQKLGAPAGNGGDAMATGNEAGWLAELIKRGYKGSGECGASFFPLRRNDLDAAPLRHSDSVEFSRSALLRQLHEQNCGVEEIRTGS